MNEHTFKWKATIKATAIDPTSDPSLASILQQFPNAKIIEIVGTAVDDTKNKNGWAIDKAELENVANQYNSGRIQLRVDHGSEVGKVIGRITGGAVVDNTVIFKGRIISSNPDILLPILSGAFDHTSIQADAAKTNCSNCGKSWIPIKSCKCKDSYPVIAGLSVREHSIVADPAYESAEFQTIPIGFAASVDKKISEVLRVTAEEDKKAEEEKKAALKAEEDKKAEEEKKASEAKLAAEKKAQEDEDKKKDEVAKWKTKCGEQEKELAELKKDFAELKKKGEEKKGKSAGLVENADGIASINVQGSLQRPNPAILNMAVNDVFKFAASRGVVPVQNGIDPAIQKEIEQTK